MTEGEDHGLMGGFNDAGGPVRTLGGDGWNHYLADDTNVNTKLLFFGQVFSGFLVFRLSLSTCSTVCMNVK